MNYKDEFCKQIKGLATKHTLSTVWSDFLEASSISLYNSYKNLVELEERYSEVIGKYSDEESTQLAKLLGVTVLALEEREHDFLGEVFHSLELHQKFKGQFFTPNHVSDLMAKLTFNPYKDSRRLIKIQEPCIGSGAIVISCIKEMRRVGINYQEQVEITGIDIDKNCYNMAFIQISLLGVPAVLIWGDTLKMEFWEQRETMMWYSEPFQNRLRAEKILSVLSPKGENFQEEANSQQNLLPLQSKSTGDCPDSATGQQLKLF